MIFRFSRGPLTGMPRALKQCMQTHFAAGFTATAWLLALTGCSLVNIEAPNDGPSGGSGGSGSSTSAGQPAATSSTTTGSGGGAKASCADAQNQTPASWAIALGHCDEYAEGNSTCPQTQTINDVCGLSYMAVHGNREVPALVDGQACGAGKLAFSESLIRVISADGHCQANLTVDANLPLGQRDLRIAPAPTGGLFLGGSFKHRLLVDEEVIDEAEDGGPARRGFVAAMDPQGEVEVIMHIDGVTEDAELAFGELATNDNSLFLLLAAKGTFEANEGNVRIVPSSSGNESYQIAVVEARLDGTSAVVHPIAKQQTVPFSPRSLTARSEGLAATFEACAGADDDCASCAFETNAAQIGSSPGTKGMRVWHMELNSYHPDPWMRKMGGDVSADSLALSSENHLRLAYKLFITHPIAIYADLENPESFSQAKLELKEGAQVNNRKLKLAALASFGEGEAAIVGSFQGHSLRYRRTSGSTEVLSSDEAAAAVDPQQRGFLVRLGTYQEIPPYYEISGSGDVSLEGASEQGRDGSAIRFLVHGRYDGTIYLADGLTLPASAAKSDFAASIVWP